MITREQILEKKPCAAAVAWMNANPNLSVEELFQICDRSDWLVWVMREFDVLTKEAWISLACTLIRETLWDRLTDERSRRAVEVTEAWLRGEATVEDVRTAAADAADAAYRAADAAAYRAAYAAYRAADAADAADAAYTAAAYTAAYAAYRAADAAYRAAYTAAYAAGISKAQAEIIRRNIPFSVFEKGG